MDFLKVLSWDLNDRFEDDKYIFAVDRPVALSMYSYKQNQVWAQMRLPFWRTCWKAIFSDQFKKDY